MATGLRLTEALFLYETKMRENSGTYLIAARGDGSGTYDVVKKVHWLWRLLFGSEYSKEGVSLEKLLSNIENHYSEARSNGKVEYVWKDQKDLFVTDLDLKERVLSALNRINRNHYFSATFNHAYEAIEGVSS